jgi:3-oxoadipate enol-lactonase
VGKIHELRSGRTLYFSENGSGPELLCLHGLGGGSYFFDRLAYSLRDAFRTVAVDLPGCGFSPANSSGFSFEDCVEAVEELIREIMGRPITILGHSMGTIVGLRLAVRHPACVARLISVGGLPEPIPEARCRLHERAREVRERGMAGVGDITMPIVFSPTSLRRSSDKVAMYHRLLELNEPIKYAQAAEALSKVSALDVVSKVRVPCLIITGTDDRYAPPSAVKAFVDRLPGPVQYREIRNCGHMPFFEKPKVFERIIRDFLRSNRL